MKKRSPKAGGRRDSKVLGSVAFAAISAVEGLELTPAGRKRVLKSTPPDERRAEVLRAYANAKTRK
jgi:hypothetical protein